MTGSRAVIRDSMKIHVCTKWTDKDCAEYNPAPRLYINRDGWSAVIALWPSGRTQFYNPIRRRWTRTWFWFTLIPPKSWKITNGKLRPMKRPWP